MTDEGFDRTIAVNLRGVFLCMRAAGRQMIKQGGGGRIISVASQAGKSGFAFLAPYCATKAGVILMTKAMAKEVGAQRINVNCVCPGTIDTPILRTPLEPMLKAAGQTLEEFALKSPGMPPIPLGRIGYPKDVANVITFLAGRRGLHDRPGDQHLRRPGDALALFAARHDVHLRVRQSLDKFGDVRAA